MIKLKYEFQNPELLNLALTQSGVNAKHNNERLEFIGDRVLGLAVAAMVGIDKMVRHGHMTAGRNDNLYADATEAVFGAIFMDGGFNAARDVIVDIWRDLAAAEISVPKDAKTALQEFVQRMDNGALPVYEYLSATGASHSPVFNVRVSAMGHSATASGSSKKAASTAAAEQLLKILAI